MDDIKVLFTNKENNDYVCFKSLEDYMAFLYTNSAEISEIKSEIEHIDQDVVCCLYKFIKFYKEVKKKCNNEIEIYNNEFLNSCSDDLKEMATEFVRMNKDGKCLRATLVALGYKSIGHQDDNYLSLAKALEIFQTSILIHDDIIDNADTRRGMETIPVSYEKIYNTPLKINDNFGMKKHNFANSMALCIGDLGFYLANGILIDDYSNNDNFGKLFKYYNDIVIKTCKGEMIDIMLPFKEEFFATDNNLEERIMEIYRLKTAWYSVVGPYCLGMILGGASDAKLKKMEDILLNAGVAFQIKDDLLGIFGDEKNIGKSVNSDINEYKQTILYSYVMNTEYKDEFLKYYGRKLDEIEFNKVKFILENSGAKKYAEDMMEKLFSRCITKLEDLDISYDIKSILKGFIVYLQVRMK